MHVTDPTLQSLLASHLLPPPLVDVGRKGRRQGYGVWHKLLRRPDPPSARSASRRFLAFTPNRALGKRNRCCLSSQISRRVAMQSPGLMANDVMLLSLPFSSNSVQIVQ